MLREGGNGQGFYLKLSQIDCQGIGLSNIKCSGGEDFFKLIQQPPPPHTIYTGTACSQYYMTHFVSVLQV